MMSELIIFHMFPFFERNVLTFFAAVLMTVLKADAVFVISGKATESVCGN